uniref:Uncharacterized protein n=1 Tax=Avena sativa TaxID=4498 RepID=A0ACD5XAX3_AVESA
MFPSECVLERRVRSDGDKDLADTSLPLFILECKDWKADGYEGDDLEIYNHRLQGMVIGVRLADAPPAVSYLSILGASVFAHIVAVDKTVIVIRLSFPGEAAGSSYLIYDAVALSLRMIPAPRNRYWTYTITSKVSVARACQGDAYALVHTGRMAGGVDKVDSLYLWRPSSSSSPPWSEKKSTCFPGVNNMDMEFSFNGHAYWVDLLCGVSYYRCDDLFNHNTSVANFGGFIPLPRAVEQGVRRRHRSSSRVAEPAAYRSMGVVRDSFIRFVSISGFEDYVQLKKRTVTVWNLVGHGEGWEKEHELSLKTLWGFQGFGDMSKDLSPMYPLLSTKDTDVLYLVLGEYREDRFKFKFIPSVGRYLLAIDMLNKIVTSVPLKHWTREFVSCGFSSSLCNALVGPCNDKGA